MQRGWLTERAVAAGAACAFAGALAVGTYLVWRGGWPIAALGLASVGAAVAYTAGPWPLAAGPRQPAPGRQPPTPDRRLLAAGRHRLKFQDWLWDRKTKRLRQ